jgi:isopentenyl diphosphate isomerase/L-lactate dehydrogenase-like FMN-dependent dehydrogenase
MSSAETLSDTIAVEWLDDGIRVYGRTVELESKGGCVVEPINLADFEALAAGRMPPAAWDYYRSGCDDERTLQANCDAFARLQLRPRVLVDVSHNSLATTALGAEVRAPLLVAPTAYHGLAHVEGECETARGASAAGSLMVVSTLANRPLEDVATAATCPLWFQLYVYRDRSISEQLVRRAEAAGYRALVLTVDVPRLGRRERDIRNGFGLPPHLHVGNFAGEAREQPGQEPGSSGLAVYAAAQLDSSLTWEALDWLRSVTTLPVVVKGILTAEDAALAVEHGAAGIIVSNHGGRQLESGLATIEALPEVVAAVAGGCEVYMDGGIRRGTDALKALALGARAVLLGRPILWGLVASGQAGVARVLDLLTLELELAMALVGAPSLDALTPALLRYRAY